MGVQKWIARKGVVGGTARWLAKIFMSALSNGIFDPSNCKTQEGMNAELEKIMVYALAIRFTNNPNHPHAAEISSFYYLGGSRGLSSLCFCILLVEAEIAKNEDHVNVLFTEVIVEELENAGVGRAFVYGDALR